MSFDIIVREKKPMDGKGREYRSVDLTCVFFVSSIHLRRLFNNKSMSSDPIVSNGDPPAPREMTVDEYSELVSKWQQAYYTWNTSCVTYYK